MATHKNDVPKSHTMKKVRLTVTVRTGGTVGNVGELALKALESAGLDVTFMVAQNAARTVLDTTDSVVLKGGN